MIAVAEEKRKCNGVTFSPTSSRRTKPAERSVEEDFEDANRFHHQALQAVKNALLLIKQSGDALRAAKRKVKKAKRLWTREVKKHFEGGRSGGQSYETAVGYMRISKCWEQLQPILESGDDLSLRRALAILRVPRRKEKSEDFILEAEDWARRYVAKRVAQIFSAKDVIFLAMYCDWQEHLADFFDDIRNRIAPLVPVFVRAEAKRWSQLKLLERCDPKRADAEKEFQQTLITVFEGNESLTPFQRTLIAESLECPPEFFDKYRRFYLKEKARGATPLDDIVIYPA